MVEILLEGEGEHSTQSLLQLLARLLTRDRKRLSTAESCTGGLLAAICTSLAGSSDWFESSFVTYSVDAKQRMLGVPVELLDRYGAVSEPVARAMAEGVLQRSLADVAVAITGLAGPAGGEMELPVGTVWFAWAARQGPGVATACHHFQGDRMQIRSEAVDVALKGLVSRWDAPEQLLEK